MLRPLCFALGPLTFVCGRSGEAIHHDTPIYGTRKQLYADPGNFYDGECFDSEDRRRSAGEGRLEREEDHLFIERNGSFVSLTLATMFPGSRTAHVPAMVNFCATEVRARPEKTSKSRSSMRFRILAYNARDTTTG